MRRTVRMDSGMHSTADGTMQPALRLPRASTMSPSTSTRARTRSIDSITDARESLWPI